jgi:hypothetical protein
MTILRPVLAPTVCLGLTSACASRAPVPGPDPAAVRSTIAAQIAQTARSIRPDTVAASLRYRETVRQ